MTPDSVSWFHPIGHLSVADIVLIASTLLLALTALLTPGFADWVKQWWARPRLSLHFRLARPACHKTQLAYSLSASQVNKFPVYIYRLEVENNGRIQARRCEIVLEGLDRADAAGTFQPFPWTTPVSLVWGSGYTDFVEINPGRKFYCDLLSVPAEQYQKFKMELGGGWVNPPETPLFSLGVILNVKSAFFSQPDRLPTGRYRLHLALYCENAAKVTKTLTVAWSGAWKDDEDAFFKECVVAD
jgi:hypothetical protein